MVTYLHENSGISNQALVFMRCENFRVADEHFSLKMPLLTTPLRENCSVRKLLYLETFLRTEFLQSGIVFMMVQALYMTLSSMSRTDKIVTLN